MSEENFQESMIKEFNIDFNIPHIRMLQYRENEINIKCMGSINSISNILHEISQNKNGKSRNESSFQLNKCGLKKSRQRQLEKYTFQPNINIKTKPRSLKEFLESQQNFLKKVNQKKENLRSIWQQAEKKQNQTFQPKINKIRDSQSSIKKQCVYQRLSKPRVKSVNIQLNQDDHFIPRISEKSRNIIRTLPVSQYLYNDAVRRQINLSQVIPHSVIQQKKKSMNITNLKFVAQKFIKQYYTILSDIGIRQQDTNISQQTYILVLSKMNFIRSNQKINTEQRELITESYNYIKKHGLSAKNICIFLISLLGVYNVNPIDPQEYEESQEQQNEFNIEQNQGRKLQKKYQIFYRNKLYMQESKKKMEEQSYSFKPELNADRNILAQNYRNKKLQETYKFIQNHQLDVALPQNGQINHIDFLYLEKMTKQLKNKKKRDEQIQENLKQCTFKPKLKEMNNNRFMKSCSVYDNGMNIKKHEELYNLAKNTNKKNIKTTKQLQLEKLIKQCTFVPKINRSILCQEQLDNVKDMEKSILRMQQARKIRQGNNKKNSLYQISYEKKINKLQHSSKKNTANSSTACQHEQLNSLQKQPPYLIIDINLGYSVDQIIIYKRDIANTELIAKKFANKYGLDQQTISSLKNLIQMEIKKMIQQNDCYEA